ncbi:MAG: TerC family protein [Methanobacteriota archaeon]
MVFGYEFETADLAIILTLVVLEGMLSFDNAAVIAAMSRRVAPEERKRVLWYGLAGAYVFRVLVVFLVAFIAENAAIRLVGGLYLVYLAVNHLGPAHVHGNGNEPTLMNRLGISSFLGIVLAVSLADLAFALDQVLVAVAFTQKIVLIFIAAFFAILFLRLSAGYMARLMDWFPALEKLAYVAVGWVGLKLVAIETAHYYGYTEFEVPKTLSIVVTLGLLFIPVGIKVVMDRVRGRSTIPAE